MSKKYIGAIDQGTTSTRFLVFDAETFSIVAGHQVEHAQITPYPGWLEHNPEEIFRNCCVCIVRAWEKLLAKDPSGTLECIGVTNQRETTIAWDRTTRSHLANGIVWSDTRTAELVKKQIELNHGNPNFVQEICGLPASTYFSVFKMQWLMLHVKEVSTAARSRNLCFGTIDSWLIYKLTGGVSHVTDITNASRTMLLNLETRRWDPLLCKKFRIPIESLPQLRSNADFFGRLSIDALRKALEALPEAALLSTEGGRESKSLFGDISNTPITGCIGDQQGALVGQLCFRPGEAKNTYGTGCFLLANIGTQKKLSKNGLLTTVGFQLGSGQPCMYAFEGSISNAGSTVQWMRDKLHFFKTAADSEALARSVQNSGGVTFVPALTGLLAPHWEPKARGTLLGMTLQTSPAHITRAAFESIVMQVADVLEAMQKDADIKFSVLKVDGGMVANKFVMELQAQAVGIPVEIPSILESTALGAAICAAMGQQMWGSSVERLRTHLEKGNSKLRYERIVKQMSDADRAAWKDRWQKGLKACLSVAKL